MDFKNLFGLIAMMMAMVACTSVPEVSESDLLNNANVKLRSLSLMPVIDGRSEYTAQFCKNTGLYGAELDYRENCAAYIHGADRRMAGTLSKNHRPHNMTILFVTGIFGQCFEKNVVMFSNARKFMQTKNLSGVGTLKFLDVPISGYSSSQVNARLIKQMIDDLQLGPAERLVVVAYSKGTSDTIEALAGFPDTAKKVDAFLSVGGVVLGSRWLRTSRYSTGFFNPSTRDAKGQMAKG